MQREIKFRVWYPHEMLTLYSGMLEEHYAGDQYLNIGSSLFPLTIRSINGNYKDYTIQQYTGLKDKNGKEIYEGDIVEVVGGIVPLINGQSIAKYIVEYEAPSFKYKIINGEHMCGCGYIESPIPEIIGNIFENPELLKNDNN